MNTSESKSSVAQALLKTLERIDRPGSYCTQGSLPLVLPGLEVDGVGPIGLPLNPTQACELIEQCEQAPYGKGEETVVNTEVRRVWQLNPDQFQLANEDWQSFVERITESVQTSLGLEKHKLTSHIYKLLLYEKDSFFVAHRDSEKEDSMVATLVVVLPSAHEGGELIVRHDGDEQVIDFGGRDQHYQVHYAAFYADCRHEIKPIRTGYRLALVYNLVLAGRKKTIAAPKSSIHVTRATEAIEKWKTQPDRNKLAVVLDHQYTESGLAFSTLKGLDRAKAQVLLDAARRSDCQAHLALLTLWESGYPEYTGYSDDEYEMAEVFDSSLTANHWTDLDGNRLPFGEIHIEDEEIVSPRNLQDVDPEEDYQEYTGNEGATLERWYRHAAIVLWPGNDHFQVLCEAGTEHAVASLEQMAAGLKKNKSQRNVELRDQCNTFAQKVMKSWPDSFGDYYVPSKKSSCAQLISVLKRLDELSLTRSLLCDVLPQDDSDISAAEVIALCQPHGWSKLRDDFVKLFEKTKNNTLERNAGLLEAICSQPDDEDRLSMAQQLAGIMVDAVKQWDAKRAGTEWHARKVDRVVLLNHLCKSFFVTSQHDAIDALVNHVTSKPKKYPRTEVQVAAIQKLRPWLRRDSAHNHDSLTPWIQHCIKQMEKATKQAPKEPTNWKQNVKLSCDCGDCTELSEFLQDPQEQIHRFRIRKDRRQHLHQIIDSHGCDLTHVTDRRGSPQTLVCTKTRATHERKVKQYELDLKHLSELRELCEEL